jgi:hypothetical protein
MKVLAVILCATLIAAPAIWFADDFIAPLLLNSRIERLGETNLPRIMIKRGSTIYCRMKADDFRFPLPPGSHAVNPIVTGGFDTVHGSVEARFESSNQISASTYESWVSGKLKEGGRITAEDVPGGLLIKFDYFGDR